MGKKIPYFIAGEEFASQAALRTRCRGILQVYRNGRRVADADEAFLHALVQRHPEYAAKAGVGISHFIVQEESKFSGQCIHIVRIDGSYTDISYRHCIAGKSSGEESILAAFRDAVAYQNTRARRKLGVLPGTKMRYAGRSLSDLVGAFLAEEGTSMEDVAVSPPADNQIVPELLDPELVKRWRTFHQCHARFAGESESGGS